MRRHPRPCNLVLCETISKMSQAADMACLMLHEQSPFRSFRPSTCDIQPSQFIDRCHILGRHSPIFLAILDDTKRIDPEILYAELPSDFHSFLKCFRKLFCVDGDSPPIES
jgi:hypothetical protein